MNISGKVYDYHDHLYEAGKLRMYDNCELIKLYYFMVGHWKLLKYMTNNV